MIAPAKARPKERPNDPRGGVHPGRLAHPLLGDRGERVVVELRHEQAEADAGDDQRDDEAPAGVRARDDRDAAAAMPRVTARNPAWMIAARPAPPGPLPGEQRDREHAQRQRREREAGLQRVVLEHHLQEDRQRDHRAAEGDLLQQLAADRRSGTASTRTGPGRSARPCRRACAGRATRRARQADGTDHEQQRDGLAALLPHQDPEHEPAHADDRQHRADHVDARASPCRARPGSGSIPDRTTAMTTTSSSEARPATTGTS